MSLGRFFKPLLAISLANLAATSLGGGNELYAARKVRRYYGCSKYMPHQGKRECARRVRQAVRS